MCIRDRDKIVAQANEPLDSEGHFVNLKVAARGKGGEIDLVPREAVDYMDAVSYTHLRRRIRLREPVHALLENKRNYS